MIVPDLLREGLSLVLCGTAPSRASKEASAYYAHPGNIFWKTLFDVGLTPRLVAPRDYATLLEWGIGLTDLNKTEWGADAELSPTAFDVAGFSEKMRLYRPRRIAFTSKTAAGNFLGRRIVSYGLQPETLGDSLLFIMPSTSGRAGNHFKIEPWQALADHVHLF
ncbi:MAG TPA: mismatch-specific DNA-glycosylase [Magnetospirillaceae bacterium]|nr:mismatch-specific DNA-glycosylase [Magnetospirillaceae bacterium]